MFQIDKEDDGLWWTNLEDLVAEIGNVSAEQLLEIASKPMQGTRRFLVRHQKNSAGEERTLIAAIREIDEPDRTHNDEEEECQEDGQHDEDYFDDDI